MPAKLREGSFWTRGGDDRRGRFTGDGVGGNEPSALVERGLDGGLDSAR